MRVVALTGAGISKAAKIPTFEEIDGIKEKLSVEFKERNSNEFNKAINLLISNVKDKKPTKAHKVLADLQIPIITMNIDGLHQKAGSRFVLEIHGNYERNNIVLYGEDIYFKNESINLIISTATMAKLFNEKSMLLVIGTSMQTLFANILVQVAKEYGMSVYFINENAEEEVPKFLKENVYLNKYLY